jgi:hypothetical protein
MFDCAVLATAFWVDAACKAVWPNAHVLFLLPLKFTVHFGMTAEQ